jgi:hypothetical protein
MLCVFLMDNLLNKSIRRNPFNAAKSELVTVSVRTR